MLRDHKNILLEEGQTVFVEAVGDAYDSWEGYKDENETRIGVSYAKLCQTVRLGSRILMADGTISIRVDEIVSETVLRGTVMNESTLGERKNCNLPGVAVDLPVLTRKDINDVQNFCVKHRMDYIAASFVQVGSVSVNTYAMTKNGPWRVTDFQSHGFFCFRLQRACNGHLPSFD
jgi:pyruvate kinase